MTEVLGQRSLLVFGGVLTCVLLFLLLVTNTLLWMFSSLLVVLGGWLGSRAILESNRVIHLERFIALDQIPPSIGDERDLDQEIHNTVRKIIRDFVSSWYSTVSSERGFETQVEDAMISTAMKLKLRAQQVDTEKLTQRILDLLGCHLQDYLSAKELETKNKTKGAALWRTYFSMAPPHLAMSSDMVEVNYIRAMVDLMLHVLVPPPHLDTCTGRFVVGELITCNVLLPLVDKLSDPDWLNLLIIDIFSPTDVSHVSEPAERLTSSPHLSPAPPAVSEPATLQQEIHTHTEGVETPPKVETRTTSDTETVPSERAPQHMIGSDQVDLSHGNKEDQYLSNGQSDPIHQQNNVDLDSPLPITDYHQTSMDSFVLIGQEDGLDERPRDGVKHGPEDELSPAPVVGSCPRVLVSSESVEPANGVEPETNTEPLLVGEHSGSSNELTVVSPMQGCSSMGTFSFEPLSSPEGPVIIQNLRITGTITAKEHRGTGSHPYTLYTIQYETAIGSETTGGIQTSTEDAEATPTCSSPVQSVAYHKVNRRYSEFLNLQTRLEEKAELRKLSKGVKGPKKILPDMPFGNMDSDKIEARKGLLETFLKQLCAIPEIANSEEMQEFLALNTDARIAFVKKPFVVSRIDKIVVNAIVDTLKTAFPRSEPQSPTEDEVEVDGKVFLDKKSKCRVKPPTKHVTVLNGSDIKHPVVFGLDQTNSVFKGMSLAELEAAITELEKVPMHQETGSEEHGGTLSGTHTQSHGVSVCEMELADVVLNIVCLLVKDQGSYLCTENIQRTIRLLFGTLINRWLAVGVANLTSPRYWVIYLQVIQEAVWPGGALPTQDVEERSQQQKDISKQQALHCLMGLLPGVASDVLGSEKYKVSWQTALDSFQDPVINRHLVYCLFDLLTDFLVPELLEENFQKNLLKTLIRDPEKMLG
ncbi:sorting nexin-19 [Gouania willdenowi]|uniref:sorting nexin-19 n=1 Tax=Gouania willdenowi TaxID=441366 RepID=UPI001055FBE2|nr:sorting nexin-19 [Gouania willdenowi]